MVIKLKDILNEQGKFDALKNKIFKSKDFKEEPIIKEPTRAEKDEAWKQENCNDPKAVIGVGRSPDESQAWLNAKDRAREKITIRDGNGATVAEIAEAMWPKDATGQFYCLVCSKNYSDL